MNNITRDFIGRLTLGSKARVSDPCYDMDVWCAGTIENVQPGTYSGFAETMDTGDWGRRIASIEVVKEGIDPNRLIHERTGIDVGVDSGQCGIYDNDYFKDHCKDESWYWMVCDKTFVNNEFQAAITDEKAIVSSSGYGDGGYDCYIGKNAEGQIVYIKLVFIEDDDEMEREYDDDFLIPEGDLLEHDDEDM